MKLTKRDVFLLLGLLSTTGGIWFQFSPAWASIFAGAVLLTFGLLGGDK